MTNKEREQRRRDIERIKNNLISALQSLSVDVIDTQQMADAIFFSVLAVHRLAKLDTEHTAKDLLTKELKLEQERRKQDGSKNEGRAGDKDCHEQEQD